MKNSAKQVRETAAGQSISATVILNAKGKHVATVQSHYSNGGTVTVDVWNQGDAAALACYMTALKTGALSRKAADQALTAAPDYYQNHEDRERYAAFDLFGLQQGKATGGGYDKNAAALSGLIIDGHTIADHCGTVPEAEKARARLLKQYISEHTCPGNIARAQEQGRDGAYWNRRAQRLGATFANYDPERDCYESLIFRPGLDRLRDFGYQIINAI